MSRTLEADDLMDELMHGEGILGTFFSILWHKGVGRRMHQLCDVNIPDTIIYLYSKPLHWFFTSRNAEIKKKSRTRLNSKYIEEHFKVNGTSVSDIKAIYLEAQPRTQGLEVTPKISYTHAKDLRKFLQEDKPNGLLQLFFDPKPEISGGSGPSGGGGGSSGAAGASPKGQAAKGKKGAAGGGGARVGAIRNSIVQTTWSPGCFFIEKRVNKYRLDNQKIDINVRAATFNDYQNTETVPLVSDAVAASFQRVCQMIADHISIVFRYKLASLVLNFKIDRNDVIWLLWCSSLRIVSEEKPGKALTATTAPPLQNYNREQSAQRQKTQQQRTARQWRRRQLDDALQAAGEWQPCPLCLREYSTTELCKVALKTVMTSLSGIDRTPPVTAEQAGVPTPMLLLFPDLTLEEYSAMTADPGFPARTVSVCGICIQALVKCASGIRIDARTRMPAVCRDLDATSSAAPSYSGSPFPARRDGGPRSRSAMLPGGDHDGDSLYSPTGDGSTPPSGAHNRRAMRSHDGSTSTLSVQYGIPTRKAVTPQPLVIPSRRGGGGGGGAAGKGQKPAAPLPPLPAGASPLEFYAYNSRGVAQKQGYAHPAGGGDPAASRGAGTAPRLHPTEEEKRMWRSEGDEVRGRLRQKGGTDASPRAAIPNAAAGAPADHAITPAPSLR